MESEQEEPNEKPIEEIPEIDHEEFFKRSIGEKIFLSCIAFLTVFFLIIGILGKIIGHMSSYEIRFCLALVITGIVAFFMFYDFENKIFIVLMAILIPLFNILGLIINHTFQVFAYVICFLGGFFEWGTHYEWRSYDSSSDTSLNAGPASKWDAWKQDSGTTKFLGIIWWRLKWAFVLAFIIGALAGLYLWVDAGSKDIGIIIK